MKFALTVSALLLFLMSCSVSSERQDDVVLSWSALREQSAALDGQYVSLCGWFVADRDVCTVSDSEENYTLAIWVRPKSEICLPVEVFSSPARSGAKVTGLFHHGGSYGLFGLYESAITDADVKLSDCRM